MAASDAITPEQVALVRGVSRTLARTTDLDALLLQIAEAARQLLKCERSSIFLHDAKAKEFWTKVALESPEIRVPETIAALDLRRETFWPRRWPIRMGGR